MGAAALTPVPRFAVAQDYPARSVRVIVPYAPAGVADITARLMGQWLSERLSQTFVVENQPGAGANLGTEAVVRSVADGYTLLLVSPLNAINAALYDALNFNFIGDMAPVAGISSGPNVMVVSPSFPAKTVPEFVAYAKANAGKINMASAGNGSSQHLSGELFKMMAAVDMVHVPYRGGGPALADLLGEQVQVYFASTASSIEYIRAGKLRALAVTAATRVQVLTDVPTMGEFLPGYEASAFYGLARPRTRPRHAEQGDQRGAC
jgi:tripartite-type tricarboxylate transporter receptor subunit TctC